MIFTTNPFLKCHLHSTLYSDDDGDHHHAFSRSSGINPLLSVGQWCLMNYEEVILSGEVTKSVGTETEVKVMF